MTKFSAVNTLGSNFGSAGIMGVPFQIIAESFVNQWEMKYSGYDRSNPSWENPRVIAYASTGYVTA